LIVDGPIPEISYVTCCVLDAKECDLLVATVLNDDFEDKIAYTTCIEADESNVSDDSNSWIIRAKLKKTQSKWNIKIEAPETSSLKVQSDQITALLEFAENQMLIAIVGRSLLVVRDWKVINWVQEPSLVSSNIYWLVKIPGFDLDKFPFCVSQGSPTFNLINIKDSYTNDILVKVAEIH